MRVAAHISKRLERCPDRSVTSKGFVTPQYQMPSSTHTSVRHADRGPTVGVDRSDTGAGVRAAWSGLLLP